MPQLRQRVLPSLSFLAVLAACGGDNPAQVKKDTTVVTPPAPVVAAIVLTAPARLTVGRTGTVSTSARTSAGVEITGKTFTYTSSNPAAVTVSAAGALTATGPGTAVISASVDNVTGTASVLSADASLVSLALTGPSFPLVIGTTAQLSASGKDSSGAAVAIRSLTYTSSSPGVATVSSTGLVTAVAPGTVSISAEGVTVTAIRQSISFTVIAVPTASVTITPPADTILRFRVPKQVVGVARDSIGGALVRPITYSTSNVDVASLDDFGLATAHNTGPVTITATSGGKSASVRLYVVPDSGFYVVTTGGVAGDFAIAAIDIPNTSAPVSSTLLIPANLESRFDFIVPNASYRARTVTTGDPARVGATLAGVALQLGAQATPVAVTNGPPTVVASIPLKPYTATITAPATAAVNSTVTVSWTFDESTQPFSFFPDHAPTGRLFYSSTNGADLTGTSVSATVTRDANNISQFSASFIAPATPGPVYIQVAADGALAQLLYPIKFSGTAFRVINIQ